MKEIILDGIPSPGAPLQPKIDDNNQQLLDETIQERIDRQRARLTWRQRFFLNRRLNFLRKTLNRRGYNQLITARWQTWQRYEELHHCLNEHPTRQAYQEFKIICQRGTSLNQKIEALRELSEEFDQVNDRLKAHDELIRWEKEDRENFRAFIQEARTWENQLIAAFRQSPRLHHKGIDRNGKEFIHVPRIREIIVKDDKVLYHIKTTGQSLLERWFNRWHSALPYGVDVANLISDETLENLSSACNRIVTVERSKRGTNLFYVISRLDSSDGIPNRVVYQKIIDWYPTIDHSKTVWCAGVGEDRKVIWYNFEDTPHILIAGATQGGKSNHINQMIASMVTMNTPQELRVLLVDLKGGIEFTHWKTLQHQLKPMLTTTNEVLDGLRWLRSIMENRLIAFEAMKAKNLFSYNQKVKEKLPRLICIVDEMATLIGLGDLTKDLHNELRVLSAQGRAVGIHLVLCTQHSSVDVLPGWVKTNMVMRISAKMPSHQSSMVILDTITAATLPNIPGRMVFSTGRNEIIAQSPYISDDQIKQAIRTANAYPAGDDLEFIESLPEPKPEFGVWDVIRIVVDQLDGHLSRDKIYKLVDNHITKADIVSNINDVLDMEYDHPIEYNGKTYHIEKKRKAYYLIDDSIDAQNNEDDTEEVATIRQIN